jgi:hypothetical protein
MCRYVRGLDCSLWSDYVTVRYPSASRWEWFSQSSGSHPATTDSWVSALSLDSSATTRNAETTESLARPYVPLWAGVRGEAIEG